MKPPTAEMGENNQEGKASRKWAVLSNYRLKGIIPENRPFIRHSTRKSD
jgi:hypothetical protein